MNLLKSSLLSASFVAVLLLTSAPFVMATPLPQDDDTTRKELKNFDSFLDHHPRVAEQLRRDPNLINDHAWVEKHPGLENWLSKHPRAAEELRENPRAFMRGERRFEGKERDEDRHRRNWLHRGRDKD